ncbi:preprotein translocase subunit SecG [Schleiferia thermophila]|jgi:preprotein translocase subunit SecG|uniref:Protein-export membrane protein SecG n=1 Tax=Schleiferia thermophila TaxID=884107 RepID=A0A368ZZ42_9FLAO|nr:preprotein translocase subunit SecG [Schleiferia thermophila]RCX02290.1 preprotein translocase subunit SecG [Schleiferia thermophila]GCD80824.1 hypothetical protein JCM30197_20710 [Schleiferia thermophila]
MLTFLVVLTVLVCILLIVVVMVQNPKGGGLSSAFGSSTTNLFGGVQKSTDFLDKATWTLSIILVVLVLMINISTGINDEDTEVKSQITEAVDLPVQAPASGPEQNP